MEDLERAARIGAITGANLKLMKFGGPLRAVEIGARARALGLPLMCGGMVETRVGMTAADLLQAIDLVTATSPEVAKAEMRKSV